MIILGLFAVIVLIIFTICLPQILYIALVGFVGFVICKTLRRKQMGQMIIVLCIFVCLEIVCEEVMPTINKVYSTKQELKNSLNLEDDNKNSKFKDSIEEQISDSVKKDSTTSKIWKFMTKYPNEE